MCAADGYTCQVVVWGVLFGLPELLNGPTHERVARFTTPAGQLAAGFDLGLGRGVSVTPRLHLGLGRATVSGYSIGVHKRFVFGAGSGAAMEAGTKGQGPSRRGSGLNAHPDDICHLTQVFDARGSSGMGGVGEGPVVGQAHKQLGRALRGGGA